MRRKGHTAVAAEQGQCLCNVCVLTCVYGCMRMHAHLHVYKMNQTKTKLPTELSKPAFYEGSRMSVQV